MSSVKSTVAATGATCAETSMAFVMAVSVQRCAATAPESKCVQWPYGCSRGAQRSQRAFW